jgi:hypothetical protein
MSKTAAKRKPARKTRLHQPIIIDEAKGLVFETEEDLYQHFHPQIQALEKEYIRTRASSDIPDKEFSHYEPLLSKVLDDPDEVWEDNRTVAGQTVYNYVGHYLYEDKPVYYVAVAHLTDDTPSFIYLHFPSTNLTLIERFRRGQLVYDRVIKEVEKGAVEGDALSEGDDLAVGLYKAMLKLRGDKDIAEDDFKNYENYREETIEEADEIWRTTDLSGNVLVSFIKDCADPESLDLHYIVVTIEDTPSNSHALLFSFPTRDRNLVDRYRHGENLHAEEITQEASH